MWKNKTASGFTGSPMLNPSLTHFGKTAVGKGSGERVFLPVTEAQAYGIRPHIQAFLKD